MELNYEEWLPAAAALKNVVTAFWRVHGDPSKVPAGAIFPDGHVEMVFNLGAPVGLDGPAYKGDQPARAVVGLLSRAVRIQYRGLVNTFGIRFHPARGAAFLGKRATELTEIILPLARLSASLDRSFSALFGKDWKPAQPSDRASVDRLLLEQLASSPPPDTDIVSVVDRLTSPDGESSVAQIARDLGLSPRQVQRRFLAAVGVPPKQFVRVFRFARVWQIASMSPPHTWAALAAEHGYADQAHMIREFRAFGVDAPTHFFTPDWYDATQLSRASGPAKNLRRHVRSVQDASSRRK